MQYDLVLKVATAMHHFINIYILFISQTLHCHVTCRHRFISNILDDSLILQVTSTFCGCFILFFLYHGYFDKCKFQISPLVMHIIFVLFKEDLMNSLHCNLWKIVKLNSSSVLKLCGLEYLLSDSLFHLCQM